MVSLEKTEKNDYDGLILISTCVSNTLAFTVFDRKGGNIWYNEHECCMLKQ